MRILVTSITSSSWRCNAWNICHCSGSLSVSLPYFWTTFQPMVRQTLTFSSINFFHVLHTLRHFMKSSGGKSPKICSLICGKLSLMTVSIVVTVKKMKNAFGFWQELQILQFVLVVFLGIHYYSVGHFVLHFVWEQVVELCSRSFMNFEVRVSDDLRVFNPFFFYFTIFSFFDIFAFLAFLAFFPFMCFSQTKVFSRKKWLKSQLRKGCNFQFCPIFNFVQFSNLLSWRFGFELNNQSIFMSETSQTISNNNLTKNECHWLVIMTMWGSLILWTRTWYTIHIINYI